MCKILYGLRRRACPKFDTTQPKLNVYNVHIKSTLTIFMSISIAQSRQQLSALIAAAQQQPQVITNRNTPVAVLVSADYFARSEAAVKPVAESFYDQVMQLRATFAPQDLAGLAGPDVTTRQTAWQRANAFADPE